MIIGGVVLLVGIGLFAFGFASLISGFTPQPTTLSAGAYLNRTTDAQAVGSVITYLVEIQGFSAGDEVTVFVQLPAGGEAQRTTLNTTGALTQFYITTEAGAHAIVIQNTGSLSVDISSAAAAIDGTALTLVSIGTYAGIAGFIVLIVGLILWNVDRRRRPRPTMEMPPPPS
ncbi:MAG: hypothetical protein ACE5JE_02100 [Thermoplasmata archaeon]